MTLGGIFIKTIKLYCCHMLLYSVIFYSSFDIALVLVCFNQMAEYATYHINNKCLSVANRETVLVNCVHFVIEIMLTIE